MRLWERLRAVFRRNELTPAPEHAREESSPAESESPAAVAARAVSERRYDDAAGALRDARESAREASVLDAILISLPDEPPSDAPRWWDELLLLVADVLVARGDRARACEHLRRARSTAAKVLRADLLCEGIDGPAKPEELDLALSLLSEVLRVDIDAPGARERWERLRLRLGRTIERSNGSAGATLLVDGPALPFTLVREVARGGSGVVYEARSAIGAIERSVALKLAHQRGTARSFLAHEARVAVRFRGPGIVPIVDVDPEEGWLAMGWAGGGSLRAHLRGPLRGPLLGPLLGNDDALLRDRDRWLRRLLAVLAEVHAERWIHGDLKPANVLFDGDGAPWLGDFALARAFGDPATPGSPGYVSPERLAGAPCDPRDDVYAVGRIVEELLAVSGEDSRLRAIASACLKNASDRPADAASVVALLR